MLNGKGDKERICRDTQNRIRAVDREVGYQKQSTMPVPLPAPTTGVASKMAGLILSASSPASSLALIPGLDSRISGAGCRLVVVTHPPDPAAARARILALIQEGFVSFICCPSEPEPIIPILVEAEAQPIERGEPDAGNPSPQSSPARSDPPVAERGEEAKRATMETTIPLA